MATIDVTTSQNLSAVTYAQDDIINVLDGATLTINSQTLIKPRLIQGLGTGRIEYSNTSTTTLQVQEYYLQSGTNTAGGLVQQNGVWQVRGDWIIVGTSTGANNQVLFSANNIGGVAIDYPTLIQVETGSGTDEWEIWNAIPEDVAGGLVNSLGFNTPNTTAGTVAVNASGVVTGTGTGFVTNNIGLPFKLPGIARDFVVGAFTSATSITIQELDGTTYTGGVVAAGSSYILRAGSLISPSQVGSGDVGKVLFFNPVTTAVRMGNGINGTKIPTGARVRVPNIHFNSALQQTTLASAITGTGAQAFTLAAAIGSTAPGAYSATGPVGMLLLISGSTVERIYYSSRAGAVVSATGMVRGAWGTTAQASFPIGTTVYWIPTNSATNNATINASPSGTIDMQVCSLGLRIITAFSAFASLTCRNVGYAYLFNAGNCSGAFDVDSLSGLGIGYQNPNTNGGITAQFSALLGVGNIRNVSVTNNLPGGASSYSNIAVGNVQGLIFMSNLRSRHWGRTTNAGGGALQGIGLTTVKCATPVTGLYAAGSSVRWNALDNLDTAEIYVSALPNANTLGTGDTFIPINAVGITDSTIRGIQLWDGGKSTRASLISIDSASTDVVFHNKNYPAFGGGLQLSSIISDLGLNTTVAHISVSNPRITTSASVLPGTMAFNRGGSHRMLLIDSITSTATGSGANAKGGLGLDVIAGPHRAFQTTASSTIIPNLADVQPIVVMSNLSKTVGSVYVGAFSSQSLFSMYTFTGGTYLDNLGRIYYPAIGDAAIIKSVYPLRGITNFTGTEFDFNYNLVPGSNTVPAGTTFEFRMVNWGTANTGAWTAFVDNASLETARAALTGYSSSVGIDLQLRITGTTAVAGRYLMSIKLPVTIDASYNPPVSETQVGISGAQTGTLLAGYLATDPNNPELQSSLTMAGSFGSIAMPYDYDNTPVDYRLVGRLPGWTFIDTTGIYIKNDISVPITQTQVVDLSNNPLYTSGVTGVAVNYGASTVTLSASRSAVQVWSSVQDSLCQLANLTQADPFSTTNGLSFFSAATLVVTGTLTAGNVIGNVTLSGSLSSGVSITGNVAQATPTNLTGVTINGNLTYNTNTPITVTLTNCNVQGTISNSGTATVTITKVNTTLGTVGAHVTAQQFATISLSSLVTGSRVRIYNETTSTEVYNAVPAGTSLTFTYSEGVEISAGDELSISVRKKEYYPEIYTAIASATDTQVLVSQETTPFYNGVTPANYTVDFVNKKIRATGTRDEFTLSDITNIIAIEQATESGIRLPVFANISGLTTLSSGVQIAITAELLGWQISWASGSVAQAYVTGGNLVGGILDDPIEDVVSGPQVTINLSASATVINGVSTPAEIAAAVLAAIEGSNVIAKEATVATKASQTSVNAIPTTPLLAANYVAPDNASVAAILADTAELQANQGAWATATGFATPANVISARDAVIAALPSEPLDATATQAAAAAALTAYDAATGTDIAGIPAAPTAAANATAVRSELTTELARIDAATSTRSTYAGADTAGTTTLLTRVPATVPTLAQIEASSVLAKESTVATRATSAEIAALNDFDPAVDVVARVTLVDTTTTNTDMRGTNGAVTSLAGIATSANVAAAQAAIIAEVDQIPTTPLLAANYIAPDNAGISSINGRLPSDPADQSLLAAAIAAIPTTPLLAANYTAPLDSTATQAAAAAALNAYDAPTKAELDAAVAPLAETTNLDIVYTAVKKASRLIPASGTLT